MTPANSTLASHALRWDARPRIARADAPQWFPPAHVAGVHRAEPPARRVQLAIPPGARMPGDRPAPRSWERTPAARPLRLRRHREVVP